MHPIASAVLITWKRNGAYAERLVADLAPAQFVAQPVPGRTMNHPAWILSHLNVYAPVCAAMLTRRAFEDPGPHRYGAKSAPANDAAEYLPGPQLLAEYSRLHAAAQRTLEEADDRVFGEPTPLERWRGMHPTIGDMLVTLMVKHESGHLGQLSAWRRAMGLPGVAM